MEIPNLKNIPHSRLTVNTFRGYHKGLKIGDGEFSYMENLTSDCYPVLATRQGRKIVARPEKPLGLCGKDALCYIDGSAFVMNDYRLELGLSDEPKDLVSMGAYVIIFPDKKYVNTADLSDFGDMEAEFMSHGAVSFSLCDIQGRDYAVSVAGTTYAGVFNTLNSTENAKKKHITGCVPFFFLIFELCVMWLVIFLFCFQAFIIILGKLSFSKDMLSRRKIVHKSKET